MAIPSILLGLPMVDSACFRGLDHRHSLRSPNLCAHWFAMTCSLFVRGLLFVIHPSAAFGGWNAGDGVPYGDLCRDTPPGVSGPTHPNVGDTRGRVSLQEDSIKTRRGGRKPTALRVKEKPNLSVGLGGRYRTRTAGLTHCKRFTA